MTRHKTYGDFPEQRGDWDMVETYAKKNSQFGCILCDKTHKKEDCKHKKNRNMTYKLYARDDDESDEALPTFTQYGI